MRIITIFIFGGLLAFTLQGCIKTTPKGNSGNPGGSDSLLVSSYQVTFTDSLLANTSSQYTVTYAYDKSNRIISSTQIGTSTNQGTVTDINLAYQFTYGNGTETETGNNQINNTPTNTSIVSNLNSSGFPTSAVSTTKAGANTLITNTTTLYDLNNYCTEIDNTSTYNGAAAPAADLKFTISNGNVVEEDTYVSGSQIAAETFTFGTNPNKTIMRFSTPPVTGTLNTDLVESSLTTSLGIPTGALTYSYTFDSQGRVLTATLTTSTGQTLLYYYNIQYVN
jgi:hypothetical protein